MTAPQAIDGVVLEAPPTRRTLPLLVRPQSQRLELFGWMTEHRDALESLLGFHGAILFRDFGRRAPLDVAHAAEALGGSLMPYLDRATPRTHLGEGVYTATDYPPPQSVFLHNESSFAARWPLRIAFLCLTPAREGGETPLADVRRVFRRISPEIRADFIHRRVTYVRNFGRGMGLSWQTAFQTQDRDELERFCRETDIELDWRGADRLRTRQTRSAVARHPRTGERLWFNHAAALHVTTLDPARRAMLLKLYEPEDLPNDVTYGDGAPIEPEAMDVVREAYREETVRFDWQENDLLLVDNMLVAHGRSPFRGSRRIAVGMWEPASWREVSTDVEPDDTPRLEKPGD